jgi:preprotein translocase subunit YajC
MTASGLFGTVIAIDGDVITLESPSGGRTDWLRGAIAKLASPPYAEDDRAAEDEDGEYDAEAYEEEYADDQPGDESYEVGAPDRAAPDGRDRVGDAGPDAPGTSRPGAGGSAVTGTDAPSQGEAERRA